MLDSANPFADRRLAMLQRLAELGMQIAERLADHPEPTETTALQFARIAKAVRQTLALEAQLAGEVEIKAAVQSLTPIPPWEKAGQTKEQYDHECREEERLNDADELVDTLISRDPREHLRDELRGDREELIHELGEAGVFAGDLPLSQIIQRIARDLGLSPDWHGLTRDEWDALDLQTRVELKAGVVLGDDPPRWPKRIKGRPSTRANGAAHPPDG